MVLKKSKFGGNTGNTIRRCTKGNKGYRTATFITKQTTDSLHTEPTLPENDERMENELKTKKNEHLENISKHCAKKEKRWLIPDKIKLEVQTECQKENAKLLKHRQQEPPSSKKRCERGVSTHARIGVADKLVELGEMKCKSSEERMNSFMNCVEENYSKKVKRCNGAESSPSVPLKDKNEITQNNDNTKELFRKVPTRCAKKFHDFTDEFYEDGKDEYMHEKVDDEEEEISTRKAMTLAMFIKPKNKKKEKSTHGNDVVVTPEVLGDQEGHYIVIDKPKEILEIMSAIDAAEADFEVTYAIDNGEEEFDVTTNPTEEEDFEIAEVIDVKQEKFVITNTFDVPVEEFEFTDEKDADDESDVEIEVEDSYIYLLYGAAWPSL